MNNPLTGRILVVDDEEGLRSFLASALQRSGHELVTAENGARALEAARSEPFDLVITDLQMPVMGGMELVRCLRTEQPDTEIIVLSAHSTVSTAVEAMKLGVFDYVEKPIASPKAVRDLVQNALIRRQQLTEKQAPRGELAPAGQALSFGAKAMVPVIDALSKVARSAATVLLLGESGTGKEVAARALHAMSPRADKPFIAINCAVLTESLLESELFGHEKGSFTGAHAQRRGRIELAHGGTFFLDEVGELKPSLQAKLLRVLEERKFERLGGSQEIEVDVRWVAATHRDLRQMVADSTFREDLYHRLAVFPIRLPPLRERREDIVPLSRALLTQLAKTAGHAPPQLSPQLEQRLAAADWPGNVRELRNALERALILADGHTLQPEHLWRDAPAAAATQSAQAASAEGDGSLADLERQTIQRTLQAVGGNRRAAAERLGIGLRTLYDKLKRYELK